MYRRKSINFTVVFLIVCLSVSLIFSGCTSQKSNIVGKWQEIGNTETVEFFSDNRVTVADGGLPFTGDWSYLDDGRIKIEITMLGTTYSMTGRIEGDVLSITIPNGQISKYQKIKT